MVCFGLAHSGAKAKGICSPRSAILPDGASPTPTSLRILILGGTNFVGPSQVRAALARGHEVTLFNRGLTNPGLFPDLERTRAAVGSDATLIWVNAAFLREQGIPALTYWTEPAGDYLGMMRVNGDKAFAAGFEMRPLEQTARETLEWFNAQDAERQELRSGLEPDREAALIAAFRAAG